MAEVYTSTEMGSAYSYFDILSGEGPKDLLLKVLASAAVFVFILVATSGVLSPNAKDKSMKHVLEAMKWINIIYFVIVFTLGNYAFYVDENMKLATGIVYSGFMNYFDDTVWGDIVGSTSPVVSILIPISLAYLVIDLIMLSFGDGKFEDRLPLLVHHILALATWPIIVTQCVHHWFLLLCAAVDMSPTPLSQHTWYLAVKPHNKVLAYCILYGFLGYRLLVIPLKLVALIASKPHSLKKGLTEPFLYLMLFLTLMDIYFGYLMVKSTFKAIEEAEKEKAE